MEFDTEDQRLVKYCYIHAWLASEIKIIIIKPLLVKIRLMVTNSDLLGPVFPKMHEFYLINKGVLILNNMYVASIRGKNKVARSKW